jgi:hypothetical protein
MPELNYNRQMMNGLNKVPVPTTPGSLIVLSNDQSINEKIS